MNDEKDKGKEFYCRNHSWNVAHDEVQCSEQCLDCELIVLARRRKTEFLPPLLFTTKLSKKKPEQ